MSACVQSSVNSTTQVFPPLRRSTRDKQPTVKAKEIEESKMAPAAPSANTSKKRKASESEGGITKKRTTTKKTSTTTTKKSSAAATKKTSGSAPKKAPATTSKTTTSKKAPTSKKATTSKATSVKATATSKTTSTSKAALKAAQTTKAKPDPAKPSSSKATPAATKRKHEDQQIEPRKRPTIKKGAVINSAPTEKLKVFVFGENSAGELGLGATEKSQDVKRPRFNPNLSKEVGVVQIAVGGMHCAALTHDNKVLTWGVNDQSTLGRETKQAEIHVPMENGDSKDKEEDSDSDGDVLNSLEAVPGEATLDNVPEGTVFTSIAASDSCTFAITDDGRVYGCGTFRNNEGILGFDEKTVIQQTLKLIPELKGVKKIVCGSNHALALDKNGNVWAWGAGQQCQLGRRVIQRTSHHGLTPRATDLPRRKITDIAAGSFHSFAIDNSGNVWAWGLNSYGETGVNKDLDDDESVIPVPAKVQSLAGKQIVQLSGGSHHTLAVTAGGELFGFGRLDGFQLGTDGTDLPEDSVVKDERGNPRICSEPMSIPNPLPRTIAMASAGPDHSLCITKQGRAWSWGFSVNYQTGQGTEDDIEEPTLIDNTATREEQLVFCGAGGQFGVVASKY